MSGKFRTLGMVVVRFLFPGSIPPVSAAEIEGHDIVAQVSERPVKIRLFSAPGIAKRPAVLLLHGAGAIDPRGLGFRSYTAALTAAGMDAYVLFYYSDADSVSMGSPDHAIRSKTFQIRVDAWAKLVDDIAAFALGRPESNGRVGVLGVSNGATLGVAAAARDARISTLVTCYGSFPPFKDIHRMPPLLVLHGDADQIIPLIDGKQLVDYVKTLGGFAQLVSYPGAGHGFDLAPGPNNPAGEDARRRAVQFLSLWLKER